MNLQLPLDAGPVRLRAMRSVDLDDFAAYRQDPEVARYQSWEPMDRAAAAALLEELVAPSTWPVGEWVQLGIARLADDRLVGDIGLLHEAERQAQIGITLARPAQGRGWAQLALTALVDALRQQLGITHLRAIADARNAASLRLFAALGFRESGREAVVVKGEACIDVTLEHSPRAP